MGLDWTDEFLMKVSEITGQPIPDSLAKERGRLVDMMTDSHTWLHGKRYALWGDPDFVMGMVKFLLELGCEPTHILANNGNKNGKKLWKLFWLSLLMAVTPRFIFRKTCGICAP